VLCYEAAERRVFDIRPGAADWAAIRFSNEAEILCGPSEKEEASWKLIHPEKIQLALEYVDNHSLDTDLQILGMPAIAIAGTPSAAIRGMSSRRGDPAAINARPRPRARGDAPTAGNQDSTVIKGAVHALGTALNSQVVGTPGGFRSRVQVGAMAEQR
jgi:hypothetical protein